MLKHWFFFHKVLHDFEVKNSVSSNKRIELSDIQVLSIMSWLSSFLFLLRLKKFILIWILSWNHLGVAKEMFETCSVDSFTKWTDKIVVGKTLEMKLWKIDKEDMENELAYDSHD